MSKRDKIWLAAGIPVFIFIILFMSRVGQWNRSIAGTTLYTAGNPVNNYTVALDGGHFRSYWRNFYRIKKDSRSQDLVINIKAPKKTLYAMANFNVKGINPGKAVLTGAAFSEIDKYHDGIKFTVRVGSRHAMTVRVSEKKG